MATQTRRGIVKNGTAMKRRRGAHAQKKSSEALANFLLPLIFIVGILFCLGFLMFMGYRTATASAFFDVKTVDIRGTNRLSKDEVEKIVNRQTEKSGVWNADLTQIRDDIEKLTAVKSAVVSRILPDNLRVNVNERIPQVVVKTDTGEFWTDDEAVILGAVGKNDSRPPFVLLGWDASRNEKANKDNLERIKIYLKMLNEWQDFELAKRVSAVNLSDLHTPLAVVQDSGETVTIILAKENLGKNLKKGLEGIAGRGKEFESIDLSSNNPRLRPRVK
jgi:cell division septal protein FtsQ